VITTFNVALSGLSASSKRLSVSANNIANQLSTSTRMADGQVVNQPFVPKQVQQVTLGTGGVQSVVRDVNPPSVTVFAPEAADAQPDGSLILPNVNLETELVQQKIATYDYRANLTTIKVQDNLEKNLLDILS
jgi:flagellar basal-body rod protein FlgC